MKSEFFTCDGCGDGGIDELRITVHQECTDWHFCGAQCMNEAAEDNEGLRRWIAREDED